MYMNKKELLEITRNEVVSFRYKLFDQALAKGLDGENIIKITAPIFPDLTADSRMTCIAKCSFNINKIHAPFLPQHVWDQITSRTMPHLFENLYPLTDTRIVGPLFTPMKCEYNESKLTGFVTFMPWATSEQVYRHPVLYSVKQGGKAKELGMSTSPCILPLLLSGYDIFPVGVEFEDALTHNFKSLFDLSQEFSMFQELESQAKKAGVSQDIISSVMQNMITILGKLDRFLDITIIKHISDGPLPDWSVKDEKYYGKALASIIKT